MIRQSVNLFINLSFSVAVCLYISVFQCCCLSLYLCTGQYICMYLSLSLYTHTHTHIYVLVYLCMCASICISVCLPLSLSEPLSTSLSLSKHTNIKLESCVRQRCHLKTKANWHTCMHDLQLCYLDFLAHLHYMTEYFGHTFKI